jgi:predicted permease
VNYESMLNLQLMLFALMLIGVFAAKKKLIDKSAQKNLTNLLIGLFLPCNIISSFEMDVSASLLLSMLQVLLIALAANIFYLVVSKFIYRWVPKEKRVVLQYASIVSNSAFLGLPIIGEIFGPMAVLYGSIALIPLRVITWSAGLSLFIETKLRYAFKKLVVHPCIIAVYIGFIILFVPFELPPFFMKTINSVGNCTTAVSMIIIGSILADIDIKKVINKVVLYFAAIRLVVLPLAVYAVLKLFNVEPLIISVLVVFAAMPAGTTTAILAAKYGADTQFASKLVLVSTLLSLLTIPAIYSFLLT